MCPARIRARCDKRNLKSRTTADCWWAKTTNTRWLEWWANGCRAVCSSRWIRSIWSAFVPNSSTCKSVSRRVFCGTNAIVGLLLAPKNKKETVASRKINSPFTFFRARSRMRNVNAPHDGHTRWTKFTDFVRRDAKTTAILIRKRLDDVRFFLYRATICRHPRATIAFSNFFKRPKRPCLFRLTSRTDP